MTDDLKELLIPAAIAVPFFIFGFATAANLFEFTLQDVVVGAFAGSICGATVLAVTLLRDRKPQQPMSPA